MINKISEKYGDSLYLVVRVIVGILFLLHGLQKFTPEPAPAFGLMWWAGIFEILIGPALILGLFTRIVALLGIIEMIVAYVRVHLKGGINPLTNGGELAVLYFVLFLIFLIYGARKWGLDESLAKNDSLKKCI